MSGMIQAAFYLMPLPMMAQCRGLSPVEHVQYPLWGKLRQVSTFRLCLAVSGDRLAAVGLVSLLLFSFRKHGLDMLTRDHADTVAVADDQISRLNFDAAAHDLRIDIALILLDGAARHGAAAVYRKAERDIALAVAGTLWFCLAVDPNRSGNRVFVILSDQLHKVIMGLQDAAH